MGLPHTKQENNDKEDNSPEDFFAEELEKELQTVFFEDSDTQIRGLASHCASLLKSAKLDTQAASEDQEGLLLEAAVNFCQGFIKQGGYGDESEVSIVETQIDRTFKIALELSDLSGDRLHGFYDVARLAKLAPKVIGYEGVHDAPGSLETFYNLKHLVEPDTVASSIAYLTQASTSYYLSALFMDYFGGDEPSEAQKRDNWLKAPVEKGLLSDVVKLACLATKEDRLTREGLIETMRGARSDDLPSIVKDGIKLTEFGIPASFMADRFFWDITGASSKRYKPLTDDALKEGNYGIEALKDFQIKERYVLYTLSSWANSRPLRMGRGSGLSFEHEVKPSLLLALEEEALHPSLEVGIKEAIYDLLNHRGIKLVEEINNSLEGTAFHGLVEATDRELAQRIVEGKYGHEKLAFLLFKKSTEEAFRSSTPLTFQACFERRFSLLKNPQQVDEMLKTAFYAGMVNKNLQEMLEALVANGDESGIKQFLSYEFGANDKNTFVKDQWFIDLKRKAKAAVKNSYIVSCNPYLQDHYRYRSVHFNLSRTLLDYFNEGNSRDSESEDMKLKMKEIRGIVEIGYKDFQIYLNSCGKIPPSDLPMYGDSSGTKGLTSFLLKYRQLAASFISLEVGGIKGNLKELDLQRLRDILKDCPEYLANVYTMDIPLYDKLYDELDRVRSDQNPNMEIFLGRDGIYSYYGRRSQRLARGRLSKNDKVNAGEEPISKAYEMHPHYLVYPRLFRDTMDPETKLGYVTGKGITVNKNPIFIDTGYTGTIPEQIMTIMGFSSSIFDDRVKLLSSTREERQVPGIDAGSRRQIVEGIEHNVKTEYTAEGLYYAGDEINYYARPTPPEEQLKFAFVVEAITRHYWNKEHLKSASQV